MIERSKKIDSAKAMAAAKRSIEFWTTIDGNKLALVGQNERDMDLVGPEKKQELARTACSKLALIKFHVVFY